MSATLAHPLEVEPLGDGRYAVPCAGSCGGDAGVHIVTIGADAARCDCPGYAYRRCACKHLRAVLDHLVLSP